MIKRLSTVAAILLLAGCSTNVSRFQMPGTDLADVQRLYINVAEEERETEELLPLIRANLEGRGYEIVMSDQSVIFEQGDFKFDYAADWHWDMGWYLLDLRVAIYEPATNILLAQAHSQQSSLVRKSIDVVVERALASLFDDVLETKGDRE
jgi:hypothetical protein